MPAYSGRIACRDESALSPGGKRKGTAKVASFPVIKFVRLVQGSGGRCLHRGTNYPRDVFAHPLVRRIRRVEIARDSVPRRRVSEVGIAGTNTLSNGDSRRWPLRFSFPGKERGRNPLPDSPVDPLIGVPIPRKGKEELQRDRSKKSRSKFDPVSGVAVNTTPTRATGFYWPIYFQRNFLRAPETPTDPAYNELIQEYSILESRTNAVLSAESEDSRGMN